MAAKDKDLNDLFLDTLKDIYFAEKQILKALPKMAKAAQSDKLRAAFEKHHGETEGQVDRLEQIFELLGAPARGKTCEAIKGILDEGTEIMKEYKGCEALDAGLLAAAQAVGRYAEHRRFLFAAALMDRKAPDRFRREDGARSLPAVVLVAG